MISASSCAGRDCRAGRASGRNLDHVGQRLARLGLQLFGLDQFALAAIERDAGGRGHVVHLLHRRFAEAALGRVDDALEGQIVGGLA
jgi:hypothetical protein